MSMAEFQQGGGANGGKFVVPKSPTISHAKKTKCQSPI